MPKYDFQCTGCKLEIEITRPMTDSATVVCPICNFVCEQIYSSPTVHYFGNGWSTKTTPTLPEGSRKRAGRMWK